MNETSLDFSIWPVLFNDCAGTARAVDRDDQWWCEPVQESGVVVF
ncbi:hypothetical protein FRC0195_01976 [Corynebacterium diphtheriae]|nr:hypothetical protein FRC0195_01976 [Corynebacterium diphtheriae]